ncbi:MAG: HU family DNA-binding protein [Actinomycetota bacterium]
MNKDELVAEVAKQAGVAKTVAAAVIDSVTDTIKTSVAKGQKVALVGFGTFEKRVRNARVARNPRTGEAIKVAKTNVPAFKPGAAFKDSVGAKRKKAGTKKPAAKKATARKR